MNDSFDQFCISWVISRIANGISELIGKLEGLEIHPSFQLDHKLTQHAIETQFDVASHSNEPTECTAFQISQHRQVKQWVAIKERIMRRKFCELTEMLDSHNTSMTNDIFSN